MGNCIRKGSIASVEWGGEEWGSTTERERESFSCSTSEVKIKISKTELEKLLKKADVEGLSVQQVLAQLLINAGEDHHRSWRPSLQSIPES